jgi:hypothetical protein
MGFSQVAFTEKDARKTWHLFHPSGLIVSVMTHTNGGSSRSADAAANFGISWSDVELEGPMLVARVCWQVLCHQSQGVLLSELKTAEQADPVPLPASRGGAQGASAAARAGGQDRTQSGRPDLHVHYRHTARPRGLREIRSEDLQGSRRGPLEHPRVAPLLRLAPAHHGRAA